MSFLEVNYPFGPEKLQELAKAQELFIRIYFDQDFLEQCESAGNLNPRYSEMLARRDRASFEAESYGRKFMVCKEILQRFPETFEVLIGKKPLAGELVNLPLMLDFFRSENFFNPSFALPHTYGIGQGYENVSKFYLWARERLNLNKLHLEFSRHLVSQIKHSSESFFVQFSGGIIFEDVESAAAYSFVVLKDGRAIRCPRSQISESSLARLFPLKNCQPTPVSGVI